MKGSCGCGPRPKFVACSCVHNPACFPYMPSFKTPMKMAAAAVTAVAGVVCAAWLQSPERAALLKDEEIASLRQQLASEQAQLQLDVADCAAARTEHGASFASAVCDHNRTQAALARERMAKIRAALDELLRQRASP
jgi:hypothetical protein